MIGPDGRLPLPWLDRPLAAALGARHVPHAQLVQGPPGAGQFELALVLAQAALCEAAGHVSARVSAAAAAAAPESASAPVLAPVPVPVPTFASAPARAQRPEPDPALRPTGLATHADAVALAVAGSSGMADKGRPLQPCGACAGCRLVLARSHPDLLVLLPEALQVALGWSPADDAAGSGAAKSDRKPSKEIRVDAVRQAVAFAQLTASRGRGRVVVVHPAERMNAIAANALLKTLEEPPGAARFVLASEDAASLLPTVRSRCQTLTLALPPTDVALAWLAEQGVADAAALLAATGGQALEARLWAAEGVTAEAWRRLPAQVAQGDVGVLPTWPLPRAIGALQKLCHDLLLSRAGVAPRYFPQVPQPRSAAPLHAWAEALRRAAQHAEHPWNAGLLVQSLVVQGQGALGGIP